MIQPNAFVAGLGVGLLALVLCLVSDLLRLDDLLSGAGMMVGGSAGLAGYYGAPVLMDRKPPTKRG